MCIGVGGVLSSVSEQSIIWFPLLGCAHEGTPVHEARRIAPVNNKAGAATGNLSGRCGTGEVESLGVPESVAATSPPELAGSLPILQSNLCMQKGGSCMQKDLPLERAVRVLPGSVCCCSACRGTACDCE